MEAITTSGQTAAKSSQSPGTVRSAKDWQKPSSARQEALRATVTKEGILYAIEFEDGSVTQGESRDDVLVMAVDLRACMDDRHPSSYVAQWVSDTAISVAVLPG